ncbi:lipopolysaccharide biosynthesis protein [Adlercreutzia sp. ZJ138]|uniref:lipopolysaccharide biosynthesis protein n=1 Tax=Adlercreutzia sp. ZJ138 TaxID=2709405 RepID=UPI0013EBB814|nr:lipopolysaccharide biosynthesis protein [Adlercreutzia sp. ZJ138]
MAEILREKIRTLFQRGFFHIFGANVINKVVAFLTNVLIVRFMTKDDYGVFSYANSIYSIILLFTGLGLLGGVFQFCSERRGKKEKLSIFRYGIAKGLLIDAVLSLSLLLCGLLISLPIKEAGSCLALLAPLLLLDYVLQYCSIVLRVKRRNEFYSLLLSTNSVTYLICGCSGAFFGGIAGTIAGRYLAYVLSIILGFQLLGKTGFSLRGSQPLEKRKRGALWRFSIPTCFSGAMNQATYLLDIFILGLLLHNAAEVASYKVATMMPEGLLFVPGSILVFVLPYFVERNNDPRWFRSKAIQLFLLLEGVMVVCSLVIVLFAPMIITALWGSEYLDALLPFRILAASLAVSPLRSVCVNLLAALHRVVANLVVSFSSLVCNVVCVVLFTNLWGVAGAAAAVLVVSAVASVISAILLLSHLRKQISNLKEG